MSEKLEIPYQVKAIGKAHGCIKLGNVKFTVVLLIHHHYFAANKYRLLRSNRQFCRVAVFNFLFMTVALSPLQPGACCFKGLL
jgi:hypothetical protein